MKTSSIRNSDQEPQFDTNGQRVLSVARRAQLVGWWLMNRVDPLERLTEDHVRWVCEQVGLPWTEWQAVCQRSPGLMAGVRRKRGRRAAYLRTHP